jgi:hypothetical protein
MKRGQIYYYHWECNNKDNFLCTMKARILSFQLIDTDYFLIANEEILLLNWILLWAILWCLFNWLKVISYQSYCLDFLAKTSILLRTRMNQLLKRSHMYEWDGQLSVFACSWINPIRFRLHGIKMIFILGSKVIVMTI